MPRKVPKVSKPHNTLCTLPSEPPPGRKRIPRSDASLTHVVRACVRRRIFIKDVDRADSEKGKRTLGRYPKFRGERCKRQHTGKALHEYCAACANSAAFGVMRGKIAWEVQWKLRFPRPQHGALSQRLENRLGFPPNFERTCCIFIYGNGCECAIPVMKLASARKRHAERPHTLWAKQHAWQYFRPSHRAYWSALPTVWRVLAVSSGARVAAISSAWVACLAETATGYDGLGLAGLQQRGGKAGRAHYVQYFSYGFGGRTNNMGGRSTVSQILQTRACSKCSQWCSQFQ